MPDPRDLRKSVVVILAAGLVLGSMAALWGMHVAVAGYIAILFLSPTVGVLPLGRQLLASLWLIVLASVGLLVAPHGSWPLLAAVAVAALGQGLFVFGRQASVNRSPTTLVAFSLTHNDALWQPFLGIVVATVIVLVASALVYKRPPRELSPLSLELKLRYGLALTTGSALITLIWQIFDLRYLTWALLLFCLMFTFDRINTRPMLRERFSGALAGALLAWALAAVLPIPILFLLATAFAVLELAYMVEQQTFLRMLSLTAALILVAAVVHPENTPTDGWYRLLAILGATAMALILHYLTTWVEGLVAQRRQGRSL